MVIVRKDRLIEGNAGSAERMLNLKRHLGTHPSLPGHSRLEAAMDGSDEWCTAALYVRFEDFQLFFRLSGL